LLLLPHRLVGPSLWRHCCFCLCLLVVRSSVAALIVFYATWGFSKTLLLLLYLSLPSVSFVSFVTNPHVSGVHSATVAFVVVLPLLHLVSPGLCIRDRLPRYCHCMVCIPCLSFCIDFSSLPDLTGSFFLASGVFLFWHSSTHRWHKAGSAGMGRH